MKADNLNANVLQLPQLAEVFEALRRGRHICANDGELYHALKQHSEDYRQLFEKLGFKLVQHARDFFHFADASNFTETASRMALFIFILVEHLADHGMTVEEAIMTNRFDYATLPHLKSERYQTYMREAGVTTHEELIAIVRTMERYGFTRRLGADTFAFNVPVYRFLDLCMNMAEQAEKETKPEENDGEVEA
jgi:chromosome condensin MukBEF MukE localization factor